MTNETTNDKLTNSIRVISNLLRDFSDHTVQAIGLGDRAYPDEVIIHAAECINSFKVNDHERNGTGVFSALDINARYTSLSIPIFNKDNSSPSQLPLVEKCQIDDFFIGMFLENELLQYRVLSLNEIESIMVYYTLFLNIVYTRLLHNLSVEPSETVWNSAIEQATVLQYNSRTTRDLVALSKFFRAATENGVAEFPIWVRCNNDVLLVSLINGKIIPVTNACMSGYLFMYESYDSPYLNQCRVN